MKRFIPFILLLLAIMACICGGSVSDDSPPKTDEPSEPVDEDTPEPTEEAPAENKEVTQEEITYADTIEKASESAYTLETEIDAMLEKASNDPDLFTDAVWLTELTFQVGLYDVVYTDLAEAQPPESIAAIHNLYVEALGDCNKGFHLMLAAIENDLDEDGLNQAADFMDSCAGKKDEASVMYDEWWQERE